MNLQQYTERCFVVSKTKSRIPAISSDRLSSEPGNLNVGSTKEDFRAKAFIKGREPIRITTIRLKEKQWESLKTLSFMTSKSLNSLLLEAIEVYLNNALNKKLLIEKDS